MPHQIEKTSSGASVVRCLGTQEVMHPGVGPRLEAEQLYVRQSKLAERLAAGPVCVFDVGLGAASNALAARAVGLAAPHVLELVSFENDVGALELALSQPAEFNLGGEAGDAARALLAVGAHISPRVKWSLRRCDLLDALAVEPERADVIYWDPFSPRSNPDLWTVAAFAAARRLANPRCTLFTYSASTATRVALLLAGWAVGVGDAIGTKQQTTAAAVDWRDLARPLGRDWLPRVGRPDAPLPPDARDAGDDILARIETGEQFRG